jgi:DNA-binding MarR family transcriptional regulator
MASVETPAVRRDAQDEEIILGVLDVVERDSAVTQRSVARELGIALGLANAYLKRCVRKGLIKVGQVPPRRYSYYLTPQGFAEKSRLTATYLSHSFSFFRRARAQCGAIFEKAAAAGQHRLLLVGAGDLAEIARLVAREYPVEIAAVIPANTDPAVLRAEAAAAGRIDAAVVTALEHPREVYSAMLALFGADQVHVLPLLRIHLPYSGTVSAEPSS